MTWNDLKLRARALTSRGRMEQDLADELGFHLEMQSRKNQESGMSPADAKRRARIDFGGASQISEECRDVRGVSLLESTWQDIRYAIRGFRRSPALVLTVVATIALGLGLDTALFTVYNATYLRPIGVHDPRSLYEVYWTDRIGNAHEFSWPEYQEFLASNPVFSAALAYKHTETRIEGRSALGTLVTGDYFQVLGAVASLGRTLLPEDSVAPGSQAVAVLSYQSWQSRFSADPNIIGKKLLLHGYPFEVVGVASPGFAGLGARPAEFWAPITMASRFEAESDPFTSDHPRQLSIVGRLRPGFGVRQAEAALSLWTGRLTASGPAAGKASHAFLLSRATTKPMSVKTAFTVAPVFVTFSLVLLIGCANVANMLLARSMSRQREIGIRLSLGASRGRLIRQLLTESVLLSIPAGIAGIAVSEATIRICVNVLLTTLPPGVAGFAARIPDLHSDFRVFAFAMVVALVSSIAFGLAPASQATRTTISQASKGDFAGQVRPSRFRNMLVFGQIAVCALLLITTALLLRAVDRVHTLDSTLSTRNTIQIAVQEKSREPILARLLADPSVEILAAAQSAPVEKKAVVSIQSQSSAILKTAANRVSPEYFGLFDIPILRGRNFTADEARTNAPLAIVSQTTAQQLFPNQEALGQTLRLAPDAAQQTQSRGPERVTVIAVVRDEISRWINNGDEKSLVYFPTGLHAAGNEIFIGPRGDARSVRRNIEAALTAIDPNALKQIEALQIRDWVAEDAYFTFRIAYWVSSAIGALALLLTLTGIYGVVSYVITQRTKEIGIRMAMGATTGAVTGLLVKESMRLAVRGAALGCVLAAGLSKVLASALVMLNPFDAAAYVAAVILVLAACAAAAWFPSRRASRIDPLTTLRYD